MKLNIMLSTLVALSMSSFIQANADCGGAECSMPKEMQEAMQKSMSVNDNHKLLDYMVGEWNTETKMYMMPDKPPEVSKGKSVTKPIMGGRYYQSKFTSTMMGKPFEGMGVTGYDNVAKQFTSSWIDNMSTHMLMSSGKYDAKTKTFTYTGTADDCMKPGSKVEIREVIKVLDKDKHTFEMFEKREGKEAKVLEVTYTRKSTSG